MENSMGFEHLIVAQKSSGIPFDWTQVLTAALGFLFICLIAVMAYEAGRYSMVGYITEAKMCHLYCLGGQK